MPARGALTTWKTIWTLLQMLCFLQDMAADTITPFLCFVFIMGGYSIYIGTISYLFNLSRANSANVIYSFTHSLLYCFLSIFSHTCTLFPSVQCSDTWVMTSCNIIVDFFILLRLASTASLMSRNESKKNRTTATQQFK